MKVRELIKRLRKEDPDATVLVQSHDQGEDETDGGICAVEASDSVVLQERCNGPVVVIR